jgi:LPS-assembly lipoprotein
MRIQVFMFTQSLRVAFGGLLAGLACICLVGCGFSLKGSSKPLPFVALKLQAESNTWLLNDLTSRLSGKGVRVFVPADARQVTDLPLLVLTDERRDKTVLSTNAAGRVREYQLRQSVTMRLFDAQNNVWLDAITLSKQRDFTYNDNLRLAKEIEEADLYRTIQDELTQAVLARLSVAVDKIN